MPLVCFSLDVMRCGLFDDLLCLTGCTFFHFILSTWPNNLLRVTLAGGYKICLQELG